VEVAVVTVPWVLDGVVVMGNPSFAIKFSMLTAGLGVFAFGTALLTVLWLPNKDERLSNLSSMATTAGTFVAIVALLVAAVGGVFAAKQLRLNRTVAKHQFLLQFFQLVQKYNPVHIRLREGDWADGKKGPETPDEWNEVGRYLGLLSTIRYLIADDIMDVDTRTSATAIGCVAAEQPSHLPEGAGSGKRHQPGYGRSPSVVGTAAGFSFREGRAKAGLTNRSS